MCRTPNNILEVYDDAFPAPGVQAVQYLDLGGESLIYPSMHTLGTGVREAVMVAPAPLTRWFDRNVFEDEEEQTNFMMSRTYPCSVLLPIDLRVPEPEDVVERILLTAGLYDDGQASTNVCEILAYDPDPGVEKWVWALTDSLTYPRGEANALLLPNQQVFLIGGSEKKDRYCPRFVPELFTFDATHPDLGDWEALEGAQHIYPRAHHSVAVLLPMAECGRRVRRRTR